MLFRSRDVAGGMTSWVRRDALYLDSGKLNSVLSNRDSFIVGAAALLEQIQTALHAEAKARLEAGIRRDVTDLAAHYAGDEKVVGWVEVQWARPTGNALEAIVQQLKALKLTMRNVPLDAAPADGVCFFTGETAVERILIGRTY